MADNSKIEWTDASWNPVRARHKSSGRIGWHCTHVSEGCRVCYAEGFNKRLGTTLAYKPGHEKLIEIFLDAKALREPLAWKRRPRRIFVCSMTDLFADFVDEAWIRSIFDVMTQTPQHTYQVLTKRPARMLDVMHAMWDVPPPNVWLGVSVEDQANADARVPLLLQTPAAVRFLSCEPLLGPVDLSSWLPRQPFYVARCERCGHTGTTEFFGQARNHDDADVVCPKCRSIILAPEVGGLDWVIAGGESGASARPMHPDWARGLRDQCAAARVPFFFKQWGEFAPTTEFRDGQPFMSRVGKKGAGRLLDGIEHNAFPSSGAQS